ncbi:FecCD family ABC transporter permease [Mesorhizobium sp. 1B3]|uniref:FecCD family ABC transporter permease n=1 Tax=Mesorhizobium sp. 1B3 TaxID=3243599 RepID=UPI003D96B21C
MRLREKTAIAVAAALIAVVAAITLSVSFGTAPIPFSTVWSIATNRIVPGLVEPFWTEGRENIVWNLRFPRALLAMLVGAGLAMAGAVMQGAIRNPLADPHLLGVSAGAAFGANLAILVTGNIFGQATVPLFAFVGALLSTGLVIAAAAFGRGGVVTLVLGGIAISFVISACTNVMLVLADPRAVASVVFWMFGGFGFAQWGNLAFPAAAVLIGGTVFLANARQLNALAMGDETAGTLGVPVVPLRILLLTTSAFLTGVMVAFSGIIGFVGLMMPHIARLLVGGDNRLVLPASAVLGAIFLVLADLAARTVTAPNELPVGVVTGLLGGLFFLALLRKRSIR